MSTACEHVHDYVILVFCHGHFDTEAELRHWHRISPHCHLKYVLW